MRALPFAESLLLFSSVFWGLSWLPLKYFEQQGVSGVGLIAGSYTLMAITLLPWAICNRSVISGNRLALISIFCAGGLANLCFNYALIYGDVVRVMVLFYLLPMWGVIGARLFLGERASQWRWFGVGLAIVGAFVLLAGWSLFDRRPDLIDIVAILSGLFFAANNLLFRGLETVPIGLKMSALFWGCGCFASALWLLGAGASEALPATHLLVGVGVFALIWLMGTNLATQWAVTQMPAGRSSILMVMELLAAVASAVIIAKESLTWNEMVGGMMILAATGVEIVYAQRHEALDPVPS